MRDEIDGLRRLAGRIEAHMQGAEDVANRAENVLYEIEGDGGPARLKAACDRLRAALDDLKRARQRAGS